MATATEEKPKTEDKEEGVKMAFGKAGQITFMAIADGLDVNRNKRTLDGLIGGDYIEPRADVDPETSRSAKDYKLTSKGRAYLKSATEAGLEFERVSETE